MPIYAQAYLWHFGRSQIMASSLARLALWGPPTLLLVWLPGWDTLYACCPLEGSFRDWGLIPWGFPFTRGRPGTKLHSPMLTKEQVSLSWMDLSPGNWAWAYGWYHAWSMPLPASHWKAMMWQTWPCGTVQHVRRTNESIACPEGRKKSTIHEERSHIVCLFHGAPSGKPYTKVP